MEQSVVGPLLTELEHLAGQVDSHRAAADRALISELRREIAELQAAVAHLRATTTPLPARLRPALARAMTAVGPGPALKAEPRPTCVRTQVPDTCHWADTS